MTQNVESQGFYEFLKSPFGKVLMAFVFVLTCIQIAKYGYLFGQWLYKVVH
jgi:hypothetical protein